MTKDQLNNSISLIGPACVGKSLLSKELGKKLNMPVINFDDLCLLIEYEKSGLLSSDKEQQKEYMAMCLHDLENDDYMFINTTHDFIDKELQLIQDFLDSYNDYKKLLGSFKPLYNVCNLKKHIKSNNEKSGELILLLNNITLEIYKYIIQKVNTPIIFDLPEPFGWQLESDLITKDSQKELKYTPVITNIRKLNREIHKFIAPTNSVLLVPGNDYSERNSSRNSNSNKTILKSFDNYYPNANIEITTNGLFNNPSHSAFKSRMYFDAREIIAKDKLKNNGTIANICDEIIARINELSLEK